MQFTTSDGTDLHYIRTGTGEPVVLIHGLSSNLHAWEKQIEVLSTKYDTLAYDCRGHGESTIPGTLTMADHTQDAYEICQLIGQGQPVTVIGISMGGYIAQSLLVHHPEVVKRAVLIATKSHGAAAAIPKANEAAADKPIENVDPAEVRFQTAKQNLFGPDASDAVVRRLIEIEPAISTEHFHLLLQAMEACDYRPQLATCDKPVLVIHGDHDTRIPVEFGEELADILPHATFVKVPHAGHVVILEKADVVNQAVLDFLSKSSAK